MYHRVADLPPDGAGICIDPEHFRVHMSILATTCAPISLTDMITRAHERRLPPRAVAVTFDDGYLDNLHVASPVLAGLGIPATFFVNSGGLDTPAEAWWDSVERILLVAPRAPEHLEITVAGTALDLPTGTSEQRRRAFDEVRRLAIPASPEARDALVAQLDEWHGKNGAPRSTHRLLTSEEVSRLAARPGHQIGAHTANHTMLTRQTAGVQRHEMSENRARLEEITGAPVVALSYPYGDCDRGTVELAGDLGFEAAVTVDAGVVDVDTDPLRLPRLDVAKDAPESFAFRLRQWLGSA
jgi:peptidoglycan/xylan/chitin deacetylase (PgdA/CDA1 family)